MPTILSYSWNHTYLDQRVEVSLVTPIPQVVKKLEVKLALIRQQLQEALETDEDAMSSTFIVEGEMMSFDVEELKIRLREREVEVGYRASSKHGTLRVVVRCVSRSSCCLSDLVKKGFGE